MSERKGMCQNKIMKLPQLGGLFYVVKMILTIHDVTHSDQSIRVLNYILRFTV